MKWKIVFIFVFLMTSLFSLTSAASFGYDNQEKLGTFKAGNVIQLIQICGNCTYNNLTTIIDPNGTQIILNAAMTRDNTYYNFSYPNTSLSGTYIVNGFGDPDGIKTSWSYIFLTTQSGTEITTAKSLIFLISIIVMVFVAIFFFMFSHHIKSRLRFGLIGFSMIIILMTTLYASVAISEALDGFTRIAKSFEVFQWIILLSVIVIFLFVMIVMTIEALNTWRIKKGLKDPEM